jgi:SAM-dependent methyltransferase
VPDAVPGYANAEREEGEAKADPEPDQRLPGEGDIAHLGRLDDDRAHCFDSLHLPCRSPHPEIVASRCQDVRPNRADYNEGYHPKKGSTMATNSPDSQPVSQPDFWEAAYQQGRSGWDLGGPAPAFDTLLRSANRPAAGRAAVVGCGRGHDALAFARNGFTLVGFDFAPSAIAASRESAAAAGLTAEFVQADIFALPSTYDGAFDYVVEHTCFCAIDPARRAEYVEVVRRLLRPDGELIGVFFAHGRPGGPPFTTDADEVRRLFGGRFTVESLEMAVSIESRRGKELLGRFRRPT